MIEPGLFPVTDVAGVDLDDENDVLRTAHLSDDGLYRWTLTRVWGSPRRLLPFIMLNPSTADGTLDDPTIRRCIGFARDLEYDGIRVVNLYAYRATKPADLWLAADPVGRANDRILRDALTDAWEASIPVIAAWGANAKPDRVSWLMDQEGVAGPADGSRGLTALHVTKTGTPGHPLYLPGSCRPVPWPKR